MTTRNTLEPNRNYSSFTPYNQSIMFPSMPDSIRRMHDSDDRANHEYSRSQSSPGDLLAGLFFFFVVVPALAIIAAIGYAIYIIGGLVVAVVTGAFDSGAAHINGLKARWGWESPPSISSTATPVKTPGVSIVVAPTAAAVDKEQQDRSLTPVKPTPSYGTNSVFNQQAARPAQVQPAPAQSAYEQRAAAPPSRNLNFEYYCNNPKGVRMEHVQWCERLLRQQYSRGGYSGYYSGRRGY
jgi:hypothetical protein